MPRCQPGSHVHGDGGPEGKPASCPSRPSRPCASPKDHEAFSSPPALWCEEAGLLSRACARIAPVREFLSGPTEPPATRAIWGICPTRSGSPGRGLFSSRTVGLGEKGAFVTPKESARPAYGCEEGLDGAALRKVGAGAGRLHGVGVVGVLEHGQGDHADMRALSSSPLQTLSHPPGRMRRRSVALSATASSRLQIRRTPRGTSVRKIAPPCFIACFVGLPRLPGQPLAA